VIGARPANQRGVFAQVLDVAGAAALAAEGRPVQADAAPLLGCDVAVTVEATRLGDACAGGVATLALAISLERRVCLGQGAGREQLRARGRSHAQPARQQERNAQPAARVQDPKSHPYP
jgi:hypothetical protein